MYNILQKKIKRKPGKGVEPLYAALCSSSVYLKPQKSGLQAAA